jgi:hypothetical protein
MSDIKLFTFRGVPVTLSLWFFLLLPMVHFQFDVFISAFIAILIHEMAHTFMAQHLGYGAYGISIGLLLVKHKLIVICTLVIILK